MQRLRPTFFTKLTNRLRSLAGFSGLLAIWALLLLASSPSLHDSLHRDADQATHSCAVTLFSQGVESPAADITLEVAPHTFVIAFLVAPENTPVSVVAYLFPPGRAPPLSLS